MISNLLKSLENSGLLDSSTTCITLKSEDFGVSGQEITVMIADRAEAPMTLVQFLALQDINLSKLAEERPKPVATLMYDGGINPFHVDGKIDKDVASTIVQVVNSLCNLDEVRERKLLDLMDKGRQLIYVYNMESHPVPDDMAL